MHSVEHIGFVVRQADNNHVTIYKDGRMVMHIPSTERKTEKELKGMVHHYLYLIEKMEGYHATD